MKVFISWSGPYSRQVANALANRLPDVIQEVKPWISDVDIEKGASWLSQLDKALAEHSFGIIVVTMANREAPWLLFEAGALSKALEARVSPLLCDLKPSDLAANPLSLRQATSFDRNDILKLMRAINASCREPVAEAQLDRSFYKWWPDLLHAFEGCLPEGEAVEPDKEQSEELRLLNSVYDEVLNIKRQTF